MMLLGGGEAPHLEHGDELGEDLFPQLAHFVWTNKGHSKVPEILEPVSHHGSGEGGGREVGQT